MIELTSSTIQLVETGNVPGAWHGDETAVRNGICNFLVKVNHVAVVLYLIGHM